MQDLQFTLLQTQKVSAHTFTEHIAVSETAQTPTAPTMARNWQPTYAGNAGMDGDVRVGTVRPTMKTNPLLAKAELGKASPEAAWRQRQMRSYSDIVAGLHGERRRRQRCCNCIRALERRGQVALDSNRHGYHNACAAAPHR